MKRDTILGRNATLLEFAYKHVRDYYDLPLTSTSIKTVFLKFCSTVNPVLVTTADLNLA